MGKIDSFLEKIGIKDTDVDEVLLDTVEEEEVDRPVPPRAKPAEPVSFGSRRSMHDRKVINNLLRVCFRNTDTASTHSALSSLLFIALQYEYLKTKARQRI